MKNEEVCGCSGAGKSSGSLTLLIDMLHRAEERKRLAEQGTPEKTSPDTPSAHGREAKPKEGAF